ncbi:hypothetical protein FRC05_005169 [Tulasnella sp. 425]|nr:hypothetical protein FRC05_005169 [Tulasnella sp. 425]
MPRFADTEDIFMFRSDVAGRSAIWSMPASYPRRDLFGTWVTTRCHGRTWGKEIEHLDSRDASGYVIVVIGQRTNSANNCISVVAAAGSARDSLAKLQFTTESNQLKFTTEVVDLSRFVRKQGDAAHSLAGFSDVWKGEMTETGKPIAIKVLRVASTDNPDDPQPGRLRVRFDRELTIWMECQHPRVLELLGYAYIEGIPCLISPWCSNGNIMEYLAKNPNAGNKRLPGSRSPSFSQIAQIAEGLVYLHGREPSVVHSDIKPGNVLVSDEGNAKICDFGISKLVQENPSGFTTTVSVKATLRYSSREMLDQDGKSTTASDVWAFGMLMLHVLTEKMPFITVLSDVKVILAIMNREKPLPKDYPELPAADPLWDVMRECWDDDPIKRPGMVDVFDKVYGTSNNETSTSRVGVQVKISAGVVYANLAQNTPHKYHSSRKVLQVLNTNGRYKELYDYRYSLKAQQPVVYFTFIPYSHID